uniref:Uncharacterized protein n=1 Tax=Tanacetum cinerariifolium TaxID=118510 RepID=A0A699R7J1_TANCI|nr:hypothetical protein [Tanacetum cinerariifolium]
MAVTSFPVMDLVSSTSTSTCLDKCAKLDAILLRASAFLFLLRGTWLIDRVLNPLTKPLAISSRPAASGRDMTCLMGWSVITAIGCA